MSTDGTHRVALLYVHPILGEGIAAYLRQSVEADVVVASVDDREAVAFILRSAPDVVVFEASPALDAATLSRLVPEATLIDVSPATASGDQIPAQGSAPCIETIVRAIAPDATAHAS